MKHPDYDMLPSPTCSWREWTIPLACEQVTVEDAIASAEHMAAGQQDVPFIVRLVENPALDLPWVRMFDGAVNLHDHDCIHTLLGRGLLPHDEAFVIGFTMGSTNRVSTTQERLYEWAARYLYPGPYKFGESAIEIFKDATKLGFISDCEPLDSIEYGALNGMTLAEARAKVGLEVPLLRAYYEIEARRYPTDRASQRLFLPTPPSEAKPA